MKKRKKRKKKKKMNSERNSKILYSSTNFTLRCLILARCRLARCAACRVRPQSAGTVSPVLDLGDPPASCPRASQQSKSCVSRRLSRRDLSVTSPPLPTPKCHQPCPMGSNHPIPLYRRRVYCAVSTQQNSRTRIRIELSV